MLNWTVPAGAGGIEHGPGVARLVEALGRDDFGPRLLDLAADVFDAGSMCAYRLSAERAFPAPPQRYCSASREPTDRTGSCWRVYRDAIYLADETFDAARDGTAPDGLTVGHLTVDDVRYRPHRERIYEHHALLDRLTVARREANGDLLAVNFYHHRHQGHFRDADLARFDGLAPLVMAAVHRDHALRAAIADGRPDTTRAERVAGLEAALGQREPTLTGRERAVCARLAVGMLYEGVASDLGISLASVKTYRTRAFARLGIHFRNELYDVATRRAAASDAEPA